MQSLLGTCIMDAKEVRKMICPYCDSRIGVLPDNRSCPHCGAPLSAEKQNKPIFPEPPIGVYKDAAGYLEIGKDTVTFFRKPFFRGYKRTIPFEEIYAVSYNPGADFCAGYLCVRQWQDRHLPMPTRVQDVVTDATGVYFKKSQNEKFYIVYTFLKQCADIADCANGDWCTQQTQLYGRYPGYYGYMEFGAQALTVYKNGFLMPETRRVIAYHEIAEVAFCEAKGSDRGGLSVRHRNDDKRIDQALRNAVTDETSIDFVFSSNDRMKKIYSFLAEYSDENNRRWAQESRKGDQK